MLHHHQASTPALHPIANSFQNQIVGPALPVNMSDIHNNTITRKRRFSQFNQSQECGENSLQSTSSNIKRSPIVAIKPEPGKLFCNVNANKHLNSFLLIF